LQITVRVDAIGLAGFDQRVEVGTSVGSGDRVSEQPVAATDHEGANGVLAKVVVCALRRHV
jgi:hypothetical protein